MMQRCHEGSGTTTDRTETGQGGHTRRQSQSSTRGRPGERGRGALTNCSTMGACSVVASAELPSSCCVGSSRLASAYLTCRQQQPRWNTAHPRSRRSMHHQRPPGPSMRKILAALVLSYAIIIILHFEGKPLGQVYLGKAGCGDCCRTQLLVC